MTDTITIDHQGHVAIIEIHRPPANYFDVGVLTTLADLGAELAADSRTRAIVLCSEGKHFCAGANFATGGLGEERSMNIVVCDEQVPDTAAERALLPGNIAHVNLEGSGAVGMAGVGASSDASPKFWGVADPGQRQHTRSGRCSTSCRHPDHLRTAVGIEVSLDAAGVPGSTP
jgi:hypothetical protein